jgi:hypothetical protein
MIVASGFCPTAMQVAVETVTGPGFKSRPRPLSTGELIYSIFWLCFEYMQVSGVTKS